MIGIVERALERLAEMPTIDPVRQFRNPLLVSVTRGRNESVAGHHS
jgi:hypothetical protein